MRSSAFLLAAALLACRPREFDDGDRRAIEGLLAQQAAAWNAGDLDGFMAAYERGDALIFTSGGEIRRGWQTTHDRYVARYGGAGGAHQMGSLTFEVLDVRALGSDGAMVLGQWTLTETPKAGSGIFSLALVRTTAGWRIVHDHTSARPSGG
ncbi:MAG: SgcJ/EcaC family oxidoreductase [Nannocystaceae bacterium]